MTREDVEGHVVGFLSEMTGCATDEISIDDTFTDLYMTTDDVDDLAEWIEEEFALEFTDPNEYIEAYEKWTTVTSIVDYICQVKGITE